MSEREVAERFAALWQALDEDETLIDSVRAALDRRQSRLAPATFVANTFLVEASVYQGSRTEILRLRHRDLGLSYALKTVLSDSAVHADMLRSEAQKHLPLQHQSILRAHTLLRLPDGRPGLLLDWMDGGTLSQRLNGPLSTADTETIAKSLFAGLAAIHAAGLVHADLTPANLLFASADPASLCIADFEIALAGEPAATIRAQSQFAAPETCAGARPDSRSDLYACGCILAALLSRNENAAPWLSNLARRLTEPDPDQRPQSAAAVLAYLAAA